MFFFSEIVIGKCQSTDGNDNDNDVEGEGDAEDGDSEDKSDVLNNVVHDAAQAHVRMRGRILRDRLKDEMPP